MCHWETAGHVSSLSSPPIGGEKVRIEARGLRRERGLGIVSSVLDTARPFYLHSEALGAWAICSFSARLSLSSVSRDFFMNSLDG